MPDPAQGLTPFEEPKGVLPTPPNIPTDFILRTQFWRDIFGKEVQSAATYSYLWMADQLGHVCLGIILQFVLTFGLHDLPPLVFGWNLMTLDWANGIALLAISVVVSLWEYRAYSVAAANASSGLFPLDVPLLKRNAIIATVYMIFGVIVGYGFHLEAGWWNAIVFLAVAIASILCAPPWLRQKVTWQKAALPYLFRLADSTCDIPQETADALQKLIDDGPERTGPKQVLIVGPVGSGRTPMVCGVGTEMAFKKHKVRYLSFATLSDIAEQRQQAPNAKLPPIGAWGPKNIFYWPWFEAEVLVIDDVSPTVDAAMRQDGSDAFVAILESGLGPVKAELSNRVTIWVFGVDDQDIQNQRENKESLINYYARNIQEFCQASELPLIICLPATEKRME